MQKRLLAAFIAILMFAVATPYVNTWASSDYTESNNKGNNSASGAESISTGTVVSGFLEQWDKDIYKFTLPTNGRLNIDFLKGHRFMSASINTLYSKEYGILAEIAGGNYAATVDFKGMEGWERVYPFTTRTLRMAAGDYYLQLVGGTDVLNPADFGYEFVINFTPEDPELYQVVPNYSKDTANSIKLNQPKTGNHNGGVGTYYYTINLPQDTPVKLKYEKLEGIACHHIVFSKGYSEYKSFGFGNKGELTSTETETFVMPAGVNHIGVQSFSNAYTGSSDSENPYYDYRITLITDDVVSRPEPTPTPTPTPMPTATPTPTPTATPTPMPTPTPIPTPTPTFTPMPTPTPTSPPSTGTTPGGFNLEGIAVGVKLKWNALGGELGYRLYRSERSGTEGISVTDFYITTNQFVDVNVSANTTYYYTVRQVLAEARPFDSIQEKLGPPSAQIMVTTGSEILGGDSNPSSPKRFILMKLDDPMMNADGILQEIDPGRGTTPIIYSNRTVVPIRAIVEKMGGTVGWDSSTQKITLQNAGNTVAMWLENKTITVNGRNSAIDVAPKSINSRTMVPIRFAAENLGCQVDWLNSTKEIVIVYYERGGSTATTDWSYPSYADNGGNTGGNNSDNNGSNTGYNNSNNDTSNANALIGTWHGKNLEKGDEDFIYELAFLANGRYCLYSASGESMGFLAIIMEVGEYTVSGGKVSLSGNRTFYLDDMEISAYSVYYTADFSISGDTLDWVSYIENADAYYGQDKIYQQGTLTKGDPKVIWDF